MPAWGRTNLWADGTNREPAVTVVAVPVVFVRIEEEVVGAVADNRVERTRPVATSSAVLDEAVGTFAVAGDRQEDGVAVRAIHLIAFHAVLRGPGPGAVA